MSAQPFLIAETTASGAPQLAGKRRLAEDIEQATDVADEIGGQVFALEPIEPAPYVPVAAIRHVAAGYVPGLNEGSAA
ncbi:hypothetical protein [Microbacterium stercoris]|uniref:Uncharacterized protein n=1 Tax=Microbacterium stercoris TaxID=2820289 RepID=A0A939QJ94_9MICO|nr:hypothetical protein [Microbacterium stercoris]MBO3663699.1 hypothetical protein [Microbacterium stercoris]